jgi:hypothetical protein
MPIVVGDSDLTGINVMLKPALKVTGRVDFTSARSAPAADQVARMSIALQSAEGRTSSPTPAPGRVAADGSFQTGSYAGGRYIVAATNVPAGWTLKSIMSNGRDISVEPFELVDTDLGNVVVIFSDRSGLIGGTVTSGINPDAEAEVLIFPADSLAWKDIGVPARRFRDERTSKAGSYSATGLPPGEYFVIALSTIDVAEPRDPKFLTALTGGAARVTVTDGEKKIMDLKTRPR